MEPVCWAGIVGIVAIAAIIGGYFKGSCKNSGSSEGGSSCGCQSKKEELQAKQSSAPAAGIDDKKEKAINDLIK